MRECTIDEAMRSETLIHQARPAVMNMSSDPVETSVRKRPRTVTRTIRVEEDVDNAIAEFARKERVSANFLISKALRKFAEWDAYAEKFGNITLTSPGVEKLMSFLTREQTKEFGQWVGEVLAAELITFWFKKINLGTALRAIEMLGQEYGGHYQYEDLFDGRTHTIICKHGRGEKWSLLYSEAFKHAFNDLLGRDVKIESTEDQVTVRVAIAMEPEKGIPVKHPQTPSVAKTTRKVADRLAPPSSDTQ